MTEHSDVVDRADSLMRRRRSFVASVSGKTEPISAPPPPISDDEDLPVLTEVVSAEAIIPETQPEPYDEEALLAIVAADLVRCLLYTSDAADERSSVDLGGRRIIKKKTNTKKKHNKKKKKKINHQLLMATDTNSLILMCTP